MKAYLVLDLAVKDFGRFKKYIAEIPAFIAKHSGKYIVQGVEPTIIEGDWKPERVVIIEFPGRAHAQAFLGYFDLEQKTLQPLDNPFGTRLSPMSSVRSVT